MRPRIRVANGALGPEGRSRRERLPEAHRTARRDIAGLELHEQVDHVINNSGLVEHHKKEKADRGEARVENLNELVSAARGFEPDGLNTDDEALPPLDAVPRRTRCSNPAKARRKPGKTASR